MRALILLATLAATARGAAAQALPGLDTDGSTRHAHAPSRIVALLPSAAEMICALGACDRLVARGDFVEWPPQVRALPKVGDLFSPSVERLVAIGPDLVVLSPYDRLEGPLARLGIPAFVSRTETLDEVFSGLTTLGALLDRRAQASEVVGALHDRLERLAACGARQPSRPSVYYEIDASLFAAGDASFVGSLITLAGGRNVVPAALGRFPKVSPELVVTSNPDVVILADAPYGVTKRAITDRPGWGQVRAIQSGRVCELDAHEIDLLQVPGPRIALGLRVLLRCLHPAAACLGTEADACVGGPC